MLARSVRWAALCLLLLLVQEHLPGRPDEWGQLGGVRYTRVRLAAAQEINQRAIYQYDTRADLNAFQRLLAAIQAHLPVIDLRALQLVRDSGGARFPLGQLDAQVDDFFAHRFPPNSTYDELQLMALRAAARTAPSPLHTSFGYATRQLLLQSAGPVADSSLCALQLGHLQKRLEQALVTPGGAPVAQPDDESHWSRLASPVENLEGRQIYRTRDVHMMRYLDSFGRVSADLLSGNTKWHGSYQGCLNTRLQPLAQVKAELGNGTEAEHELPAIKFRYCLAGLRSFAWRATREQDKEFIRLGVCLPEACDSLALERPDSAAALDRLAKFNLAKPFNSNHYQLAQLYCLPDERSPLRRIPLAGQLFLAAACLWLLAVMLATIVRLNVQKFYTQTVQSMQHEQQQPQPQLSAEPDEVQKGGREFRESDLLNVRRKWIQLNMYLDRRTRQLWPGVDLIGCLSLYSSWLKYTRHAKLAIMRHCRAADMAERHGEPNVQMLTPPSSKLCHSDGENRRQVDTSSLNALKVMALVWIIAGHCILYLGSAISNVGLLTIYLPTLITFALVNGAIYITELFFIITGCLTSYLIFKRNTELVEHQVQLSDRPSESEKQQQFVDTNDERQRQDSGGRCYSMSARLFNPAFWLLIPLYRYLRIVPTYLAMYAFVKLVSVYAGGSGPMWDYAVATDSVRRHCVQESWLPVLTLTSNYVYIYQHCILGGWYLSVDMQFAVLAIPLLILLARAQRLATKPDNQQPGVQPTRLLASFGRPIWSSHALILLLAFLSGLLSIVYAIFWSQVDLSYLVKFSPHAIAILSQNINMYTNTIFRFRAFALGLIMGHLLYLYEFKRLKLPKFVQQHGSKLTCLLFALGFITMFLPVLYPVGKIKLSHDVTAIATILTAAGIDLFACSLIFMLCIGKAPKLALFLLNSPFWSLLSSLSLSVFLIHTELIVLLTSQLDPPPATSYSLLFLIFSATLLLTYTLALALYLAFELPMASLIGAILKQLLAANTHTKSTRVAAAATCMSEPSNANGNKQA